VDFGNVIRNLKQLPDFTVYALRRRLKATSLGAALIKNESAQFFR
jgi:hypothetical protein